jgi:hypothetical protein
VPSFLRQDKDSNSAAFLGKKGSEKMVLSKATRNENGSRALDCAAILWILEFLFISILCFIEEFCAAWLIVVNH